jgi:hypothetical protein
MKQGESSAKSESNDKSESSANASAPRGAGTPVAARGAVTEPTRAVAEPAAATAAAHAAEPMHATEPAQPAAASDTGAAAHAASVAKKDVPHAGHAAAESISPEAAAQLSEAEHLLDAGDPGEAIRKTRQSFFTQKTDRGWALLARAFCAKGDLENAKASLRNVHAGSAERSRATRACKGKGIDLR